MIGIFILGYVAFLFYKLAEKYGKNGWQYVAIVVFGYFFTAFLLGIISFLIIDLASNSRIDYGTEKVISIICGLIAYYGVYLYYKRLEDKWKFDLSINNALHKDDNILDDF